MKVAPAAKGLTNWSCFLYAICIKKTSYQHPNIATCSLTLSIHFYFSVRFLQLHPSKCAECTPIIINWTELLGLNVSSVMVLLLICFVLFWNILLSFITACTMFLQVRLCDPKWVPLEFVLSRSTILSTKTYNFQNISVFCLLHVSKRVADSVLTKISLSKIFPKQCFHLKGFTKIVSLLLASLSINCLTLPMLRLLLSKAQGCKHFWKPSKPCHVGIYGIALAEYSQRSTQLPVISQVFCIIFVLVKLATSSIWVKNHPGVC